jgi:putative chitinase
MIDVDRERWFDAMRGRFGRLTQAQVDGTSAILDGMAADRPLVDLRHGAYVLATAWHETDLTMQPIREYGRGRGKRYGVPGRNGGQVPYGRGHVQLTWDANYERADRELQLGGALVRRYDLALDPAISYRIMSRGMLEGWFTGRKLGQYIAGPRCNYVEARRVVNGTDRAATIATYARGFEAVLRAAEKKTQGAS